ncbi:hypothetical protein GWK47_038193 [Chionoecetes opilio]|uniref:Uncharacterized protein n=1 Tax=Chionoecetes opilio TaxID=41210 RepID=A0A8J4YL41_CHIOP|nr:hypothetical protein GWK47_038193 [Chionoecetes opilio]
MSLSCPWGAAVGGLAPSRSRCITTIASRRCRACSRACWMATSSVWRVEQLSDVRQDISVPPVTNAARRSATIRVDRAVSEVYAAVPLDDLGHGHQRVLPQLHREVSLGRYTWRAILISWTAAILAEGASTDSRPCR